MKNENENENIPDIEQGLHELLCAYVFGELQGAERTAFEAELLRSPELQRERERLTATVALVKRAVPDEGLSTVVRRDLVAAARRSRFRFLRGRSLVRLAAAVVLIAGGALAVRLATGRRLQVQDSKVARAPGSAGFALKERMRSEADELEGLRVIEYAGDDKPPAAPSAAAPAILQKETRQLEALAYSGEGDGQALVFEVGATSIGVAGTQLSAISDGAAQAILLGVPETDSGHYGTGTPSAFVSRRAGGGGAGRAGAATKSSAARALPPPAAGGAYRGPSDSRAPAQRENLEDKVRGFLSVESQAATPAALPGESAPEVERLRELGYIRQDDTADLEGLGYGGGQDDTDQDDTDEARRKGEDSFQARREPVRTREQVAVQVEELLGASRVAPGETPSDMFFRYWGDSPFLLAEEQKTSTFAVDVDTASYALARAYLFRNELPPREAVRTEEFVNYFKADQAPPTDGKPFAIGLELAPSLFTKDARTEMLRVTVRGKDVAESERQPVALTFVIDNSGSMADGGRLELVKRSLALLLRQLGSGDSVAVVKFSNQASVVTSRIPAARRGELESLIQALPIEGGTNVEAGLRLGYELALQDLARNTINRVILCSDGVGNIGETSAMGLLALVQDARAKGIYLNTVGVGMGNHNDAFLEELADKGDGLCNYVDSEAEAKRVFVDGLASALQPIARDVKIQVEFDAQQVESWRLLGYENRALRAQDFKNDAIDAGEVNAGHQVTALYELVRRPSRSGPLATVRLRYKPPFAIDQGKEGEHARAEAGQALEVERTLAGSAVLPGFAAATNGFQRAVFAAQLAETLRQSAHARGDSFAELLRESRRLEKALGDPDFSEFVTLLERANPLLDARSQQETPRVQQLLDELSKLHYEQALRERRRELATQAGEPAPSAGDARDAEQAERAAEEAIQRMEAEVRVELYRVSGIEQPTPQELEALQAIGYAGEK